MPHHAKRFRVSTKKVVHDLLGSEARLRVIPPFLLGSSRRIHAAVFSFIAGVMPPIGSEGFMAPPARTASAVAE